MNKTRIITLLVLLLTSVSIQAQGVVRGEVRTPDGAPVEFVNIGVLGSTTSGTVTDARGRYRLQLREADSVTLRFSSVGYQPREFRVCVRGGQVLVLDCELTPASTTLEEVQVKDERIRTSTFTQIDVERLENTVGPQQGVESLIKTLPDVTSNNELSSQYSVRGGSFDENLVYINGVEIYRPQLVRSGQQEGMSIINPDMVDHLMFSPGGFDATYGDKLSSALDIFYSRPVERRFRLSASLLGGSASAQGRVGDRLSYSLGFRLHNNRYLFNSMATQGAYTTSYTDLQGVLGYKVNDNLDLSLLTIWTRNIYGLVPESSTVSFGSFNESLLLNIYFDGAETDRYNTLLAAFTLDWHPTGQESGITKYRLRWTTSAQLNREQELYDIQSQYFLYEVGLGETGDTNRFDRGVGTFLEHARNFLRLGIYSTELRFSHDAPLGLWTLGLKAQAEQVHDKLREWKWVDSAGYAFPLQHPVPGLDDTVPYNPLLQRFASADNAILTLRATAYAQREVAWESRRFAQWRLVAGLRGQAYGTPYNTAASTSTPTLFASPRLSLSYKPNIQNDILYRLAAGIYQQPYLYREMRRPDGSLLAGLPPQCSYQAAAALDWNLHIASIPIKFTADIYYKYITHLVPYTIDNLRIRYNPDQDAVGYVAGLSLRATGDFVPGLQSWLSLSLMQTQENQGYGWIRRPTDQRFSIKLFLQDYIPTFPWWRMSLNLVYGSRLPVTYPYQKDLTNQFQLPAYFRVDWGNTVQLTRFDAIRRSAIGRLFTDLSLGVEVFNLFNYRNVVSFIWVSDYTAIYHAVPNYLTARQLNVKLTATF